NLFSDLLVHDMGVGLADGISQGEAGPREFRTAPLWGLGQRIFFLHDGRTADLLRAIQQHSSSGSEANGVIWRFNNLRESDKQDLLNFLRSL
ncbi:MAG TPA: di-heme oxidoredictase family protein, partial [Burkholderiales bacterium]|nr:di-heme oxidoredictase family protein [Burkholderiales bacterium]